MSGVSGPSPTAGVSGVGPLKKGADTTPAPPTAHTETDTDPTPTVRHLLSVKRGSGWGDPTPDPTPTSRHPARTGTRHLSSDTSDPWGARYDRRN